MKDFLETGLTVTTRTDEPVQRSDKHTAVIFGPGMGRRFGLKLRTRRFLR